MLPAMLLARCHNIGGASTPNHRMVTGCRDVSLCVVLVLILSSCAAPKLPAYVAGAAAFADGVAAAGKVIDAHVSSTVADARMYGLLFYVEKGRHPDNIDEHDVPGSFSRFVCAGTGAYARQKSAIAELKIYQQLLGDLTEAPPDTIADLWASIVRIRGLRKDMDTERAGSADAKVQDTDLAFPLTDVQSFDDCNREVLGLLEDLQGETMSPRVDRGVVSVVYEALAALQSIVEQAVKAGLRAYDEQARAIVIKEVIEQHRARMDQLLKPDGEFLSDQALQGAARRQQQAAIILPYQEFKVLCRKDDQPVQSKAGAIVLARAGSAEDRKLAVLQLGRQVHDHLRTYDSLRQQPDPAHLLALVRSAHRQLAQAAESGVTTKESIAYLQGFAQVMKDLAVTVNQQKGAIARGIHNANTGSQ
jgi:hypothetical protein